MKRRAIPIRLGPPFPDLLLDSPAMHPVTKLYRRCSPSPVCMSKSDSGAPVNGWVSNPEARMCGSWNSLFSTKYCSWYRRGPSLSPARTASRSQWPRGMRLYAAPLPARSRRNRERGWTRNRDSPEPVCAAAELSAATIRRTIREWTCKSAAAWEHVPSWLCRLHPRAARLDCWRPFRPRLMASMIATFAV